MEIIVDLHIHSRFAYATSKNLTLSALYHWSKIKGINIIGTGDFTHPQWFQELTTQLEPAEQGLYKLKTAASSELTRFILTTEVSCVYLQAGKVRKVHNLIVLPSLRAVAKLNQQLTKYGNLAEDGRPTLKLNSADLVKLVLAVSAQALVIPAHIWTPWFGVLGSKTGFDSLMEAFGEEYKYIYAIETGLSSDPAMNWKNSEIRSKTIMSFSDAHSLPKLAREATVLNCELSYDEIYQAIKTNDKRIVGTLEFYPAEGKYHLDGHRAHNLRLTPAESEKLKGICPVCGRKLTIGVLQRTQKLSDYTGTEFNLRGKTTEYIVPLQEIIAETKNIKSVTSKSVQAEYLELCAQFGSEFEILRRLDLKLLQAKGYRTLAQALQNMRTGKVVVDPGYDGVFGKVRVL